MDQPVQANPALDPTNWFVTLAGFRRLASAAVADGSSDIVLTAGPFGAPAAGRLLEYAPPPFDVLGLTGAQTVAFTNFPIA